MAEKAKKPTKTTSKIPAKKTTPSKPLSVSNEVEPVKQKSQIKNWKIIAVVVLIFVLVVILMYLFKGVFVAATVNGEPITRIEVVKALEKQSGAMVLENLITKKLILQEAKDKNINVSQADIDAEIKKISDSLKNQGTTLDQALETQGMTKKELNEEIRIQLTLKKLTEGSTKVSEKEIQDFITANDAQFEEGSTDVQKKSIAKTQLEQQKAAQKSQEILAELQKRARIMRFAGY